MKKVLTTSGKCDIIYPFRFRWCGSMAEQLICNQQVDGSTPFTSSSDIRRHRRRIIPNSISYGSVPEWPKGTDCKSAGNAFGGPNPPAPTKQESRPQDRLSCFIQAAGLVYHRRAKCGVYHQGRVAPLYLITRQRASSCGLMIYNASH